MPPDYSGQNLRGRSFRGQILEGANFSYADIRSADFSGAKLRGANFSHAKAGLQRWWVAFLVVASWAIAAVAGLLSGLAGYFMSRFFYSAALSSEEKIGYQIAGLTVLVIFVVIGVITIRRGIQASLGAVAIAIAIVVALAVVFAGAGVFAKPGFRAFFVAGAIGGVGAAAVAAALAAAVAAAVAGAGAIAVAGVGAIAVAIAIAIAAALVGAIAAALALAIATSVVINIAFGEGIAGAIAAAINFAGAIAVALAVALAGVVVLFSTYISWRALKGDSKQTLIRNIAVAFAAIGGTSFRSADLKDADFTQATLKNTDFRKANLTRTCFHKTKELDRVRLGTTYLQDKELRQLLVTGSGSGKDFNNRNLRELDLSGANLTNASFIGTNFYQSSLKEADLTGAILVRTQFESTDLTGATLTGACIEDWVVTSTTKLNGIECKYVFMKYTDGDKRDQIPPKGEFNNDDFILFVQSILDTIKLYHERDVNPKLALYVLQTLSEDYQCTLEIVKIEKRGESGAIIEVKIPGNFNQEKLKETYYEKYNQYLKFYMTDPKNELKSPTNIENVTVHKGVLIGGSLSNSTVRYTIDTEGDTIMPEGSKQQFNNDLRNAQFAGGLVNADKVEVGQLGGNINNYTPQQRQNLAVAAAEIQQLLQQLEQTNPTTTNFEKTVVVAKVVDEIEKNPTLKARVIGALKSGGKEALKEAIDHPLVNILMASIEGWQEAE